jgi:hypothetical protein
MFHMVLVRDYPQFTPPQRAVARRYAADLTEWIEHVRGLLLTADGDVSDIRHSLARRERELCSLRALLAH